MCQNRELYIFYFFSSLVILKGAGDKFFFIFFLQSIGTLTIVVYRENVDNKRDKTTVMEIHHMASKEN